MNALDNAREGRATDMLLNYETVSGAHVGVTVLGGHACMHGSQSVSSGHGGSSRPGARGSCTGITEV